MFTPIPKLIISIGISKEAKAEVETHQVTTEDKIRMCQIEFRVV